MTIEQKSWEDASFEIEQAWVAYVKSLGHRPHHEVMDNKNTVYSLARRWASGFPKRTKTVNEYLDALQAETFGGEG